MRYQSVLQRTLQQRILQVVDLSCAQLNAYLNLRANSAGNISSSYQTSNNQISNNQTSSHPLTCHLRQPQVRQPQGSSLKNLEMTYG
jgi:hypothetical protein